MNFREFLQEHIRNHEPVFFDGGMGTIIQTLQAKDKVPLVDFELKEEVHYHAPDELSITAPELIKAIHSAYLKAGANIITTNTFGATPIKLEDSSYKTEEIIEAAVRNAKEAIAKSGSKAFIALDVSSSGKLLEPMGPLTFDEAYENYKTTMIAGEKAGADLVLVETMSDLYETKAAVLAARENTNLPVIVSATFQNNLRTLTGADPLTAIVYLESMGVEAAGFNCGGSLADAAKITETMADYASVPLLVQPNAGLPVVENGKTIFKVKPEEFAEAQAANFKTGALILGGCCGTTPSHIQAMVKAVNKIKADKIERKPKLQNHTIVSSYNECVDIGSPENGPVIIGERINPTGKKKFKQALIDKNMQYIIDEASNQINAGAHILDVNVGLPGIDEQQMMVDSVKLLQSSFRIPLQIDSSEPPVLEKALRYYNGKALINSVNGKKHVMEAVFPIVKKYGGSVVALALDENGIPPTAEERLAIADLIFKTAESYGIPKRDIVIDSLTLTISSQQKEARETLRTIQLVKQKHGCKTVLGVSNISFGLPRREIINSHFFTQALAAGLDACIINPLSQDMMAAFRAFRAIAGFDANCLEYIENYANTVAPTAVAASDGKTASAAPAQKADATDLKSIIVSGFKDRSAAAAKELLQNNSALDIINNHIVPALDEVGKDFESGRKFLPQLLLSAETVSKAFEVIKAHLAASGEAQESKGKIVIATVQGDVHDIGKNIVKAMLENYGYNVIDLGKDVPVESVVNAVKENDIKLVGLSALMTTTVASMEQTIKALRVYEKETGKTVKIMVGGAVLTAEYAKKIDADYYAKDAMNSVEIAKEVFGA